ncbi:DNA cytosine methyltransferase [Clostridium sporogenes]|uniref:DNA cytosine methyltransferase n=1 Tax=Clostridium sporogenes TaxID=1509 RepID=UPI0013D3D3CC|nr:DNA cytosine methyltransferase [Clostridium sporogenes]NFF69472.1 DNA cytosine methyltransferase [Clostridium sporogenes]NFG00728.1 DNA cytosine methyltransferase [Clostridium sporogenes]NFG08299.1 DNA cytosine methyltransferase [Clostridium sporogenes]NFG53429.1 DNA cytosine methyltransferase [Clostridium sporogenes]NFP86254.1 DNA cytosine methyltransferase [Clostridium sporogenes]
MKFIDMFCGIGTVRMGFEHAGHECVYSIEWDKWKRKIYSIIFGGEPEGGDITKCRANELPKSDCWCFGAPCQDFSIAGKRAGLKGDRSSMVREVFRLLWELEEEHRPKWLLYENVKGMLSSNKGYDFFEILLEMEKLGYDCEWQVLNSKNFGVPQNRERVFTIGHLRRRSKRKIFPIRREDKNTIKILGYLSDGYKDVNYVLNTTGIAKCLTKMEGGNRQPKVLVKPVRGRVGKGIANTLDTKCQQGTLMQGRIRRLTPKECWRLQGIQDIITNKVIAAGISDTQMYRGAGDACTVNVIYEIAKRMS